MGPASDRTMRGELFKMLDAYSGLLQNACNNNKFNFLFLNSRLRVLYVGVNTDVTAAGK